jgi:hypothetical protein
VKPDFDVYEIPVMKSSIAIRFDFSEALPYDNLVLVLNIIATNVNNPPGFLFKSSKQAT